MLAGQLRLGVLPDERNCPAISFYEIGEQPQRNVRIKIDAPEKG